MELFGQELPLDLNLELLKEIDLSKYPPSRLHFLVYALQNGLKPPSQSSMKRSEKRNQRKTGAEKANQIIRRPRLKYLRQSQKFVVPNKYGDPVSSQRYALRKDKLFQALRISLRRFPRPATVIRRKQISLPRQLKQPSRGNRVPKIIRNAFRSHMTDWILRKAAREQFRSQIQNYYQLKGIKFDVNKKVPLYFQKKKANQQRRRRQKHLLIQSNKPALIEIFGDGIFKRGWPVSRKEIKLALGIKEQDHMKPQFLGQFMEMVEQKRNLVIICQNEPPKNKNMLAPKKNEISRMFRKIPINVPKNNQNQDAQAALHVKTSSAAHNSILMDYKSKKVYFHPQEDDFPSIFELSTKRPKK